MGGPLFRTYRSPAPRIGTCSKSQLGLCPNFTRIFHTLWENAGTHWPSLSLSSTFGLTDKVEIILVKLTKTKTKGLYLSCSQLMLSPGYWHETCFTLTGPKSTYLTAHNWQKWKRVFLTHPYHKIYRDEAVGLKSCKYTWKITIFVKMWNLGQYCKNLIFCQKLLHWSSNL